MKQLLFLFSALTVFQSAAAQDCSSGYLQAYQGNNCEISVFVSPDGKSVYTSNTRAVKQWDLATKKPIKEWPIYANGLTSVSADGRFLAYYAGFNKYSYDLQNNLDVKGPEISAQVTYPSGVMIGDNEKNDLLLYDPAGAKTIKLEKFARGFTAFQPNLAAWGNQKEVTVYDVEHKKTLQHFKSFNFSPNPAFSLDGKKLFFDGNQADLASGNVTALPGIGNFTGKFMQVPAHPDLLYAVYYNLERIDNKWKYVLRSFWRIDLKSNSAKNMLTEGITPAMQKKLDASIALTPAPNGEDFFIFNGRVLELTDAAGKVKDKLDLFAITGDDMINSVLQHADDSLHMIEMKKQLTAQNKSTPEANLVFPGDRDLHFLDKDGDNGLVLMGTEFLKGIFSIPENKFITVFSVSGYNNSVKLNAGWGDFFMAPGGKMIARVIPDGTELYDREKFLRMLPGVEIAGFIDDHTVVAVKGKKRNAFVYDLNTDTGKDDLGIFPEKSSAILSPDRTKLLLHNTAAPEIVYDLQAHKILQTFPKYSFVTISDKYVITREMKCMDINTLAPVQLPGLDNINTEGSESGRYVSGNVIIGWKDEKMWIYDLNKKIFLNDKPLYAVRPSLLDKTYFSNPPGIFEMGSHYYPEVQPEGIYETAVSALFIEPGGKLRPYLFHSSPAADAKKKAEKKAQDDAASAQMKPAVQALLSSLPAFPGQWQLDYANYSRVDITNDPVIDKYYTFLNGDRMYALGKFCSGGSSSVLALDVKKAGSGNDQYNLTLINISETRVTDSRILGTTQKAGGNTTQVADVTVAGRSIIVTTTSSSGKRTETFNASCN